MVLANKINDGKEITFEFKNVGPVANAKLNINKINVIGGKNATGKSTSSKLLYTFLRANAEDNQDLALEGFNELLKDLVNNFRRFMMGKRRTHYELFEEFRSIVLNMNANTYEGLVQEFYKLQDFYYKMITALELSKNLDSELSFDEFKELIKKQESLEHEKNNLLNELDSLEFTIEEISVAKDRANKELENVNSAIEMLKSIKDDDTVSSEVIPGISEHKASIEATIRDLNDLSTNSPAHDINQRIKNLDAEMENIQSEIINNRPNVELNKLQEAFDEIEEYIVKSDDADYFYEEALKILLDAEFGIKGPNNYGNASLHGYYSSSPFGCDINFNEFSFKNMGVLDVDKVFYIDSYSIFDFRDYLGIPKSLLETEHSESLQKALFNKEKYKFLDDHTESNKIMKFVEDMINEIAGGKIVEEESTLQFVPFEGDFVSSMKNTASGIKQISIIQTLLLNKHLKPGSFLIFDEPEVNMHPEWQLKLAQALVVLAIEGNINLYINTHSPLFISCIDTFTKYYDIQDDVSYYLTVDSEDEDQKGRYDFIAVPNDNLQRIFDNLGEPYGFLNYVDNEISHNKK